MPNKNKQLRADTREAPPDKISPCDPAPYRRLYTGVEADQHSLLAIYSITGGLSTWRYSDGWADAAENVDEWEGVSTDANGRVVSLVLPFNRCERPPSAGRTFAELFRGAMARRRWMRWTPPRALTILNLSGNKLSGE